MHNIFILKNLFYFSGKMTSQVMRNIKIAIKTIIDIKPRIFIGSTLVHHLQIINFFKQVF